MSLQERKKRGGIFDKLRWVFAPCGDLFVTAGNIFREMRWFLLLGMLLLIGGAVFLHQRDAALLEAVIGWSNGELRDFFQEVGRKLGWESWAGMRRQDLKELSRVLYFWGDFLTGSLLLSCLVWLIGRIAGWRLWRVAALAALIASAGAGISANIFRLTSGRPRPVYSEIQDGFYGSRFDHRYHAFPSGHSATAWGTASALLVAVPVVGVPASLFATAIVWSRMYLRAHHPADVWTGSGIGIIWGLVMGMAARRLFFRNRMG